MNICIYGASSAELEQIYYEKTEELGKMMAKRGHGLVFGGGATGMMGAAARGVDSEEGVLQENMEEVNYRAYPSARLARQCSDTKEQSMKTL